MPIWLMQSSILVYKVHDIRLSIYLFPGLLVLENHCAKWNFIDKGQIHLTNLCSPNAHDKLVFIFKTIA